MYTDPSGDFLNLIWGMVALVAFVVLTLVSCSNSSSSEPEPPENITDGNFTYHYSKDEYDVVDGCVNYSMGVHTEGNVTAPVIKIYNSINYTDIEDERAIIEHIINTHKGKYSDLSTDNISYYLSEWQVHNVAYMGSSALGSVFTLTQIEEIKDRARDVDLNTNDNKALLYKIYGKIIGIYNE